MNSIQVIGNISTDIELKATQSGKFVASFNIAVNSPFNKDKTNFIPVEIWGKNAENTSNFCSKGSKVGIVGHIEVDQWERDGQRKSKTKIVGSHINFLTPKGQGNQQNNQTGGTYHRVEDDPFASGGQTLNISDDDLPF